jgi:hypothetical protein
MLASASAFAGLAERAQDPNHPETVEGVDVNAAAQQAGEGHTTVDQKTIINKQVKQVDQHNGTAAHDGAVFQDAYGHTQTISNSQMQQNVTITAGRFRTAVNGQLEEILGTHVNEVGNEIKRFGATSPDAAAAVIADLGRIESANTAMNLNSMPADAKAQVIEAEQTMTLALIEDTVTRNGLGGKSLSEAVEMYIKDVIGDLGSDKFVKMSKAQRDEVLKAAHNRALIAKKRVAIYKSLKAKAEGEHRVSKGAEFEKWVDEEAAYETINDFHPSKDPKDAKFMDDKEKRRLAQNIARGDC